MYEIQNKNTNQHFLAFFEQTSVIFTISHSFLCWTPSNDNHVGPQRNSCAEKVIFSLILAFLSLFRPFVEFLNPWFIPVIHWNILWKAVSGHKYLPKNHFLTTNMSAIIPKIEIKKGFSHLLSIIFASKLYFCCSQNCLWKIREMTVWQICLHFH